MTHYDASLYTARRLEMCNIVEATFIYLIDRPKVHSPYSNMPFMVSQASFNLLEVMFLFCVS